VFQKDDGNLYLKTGSASAQVLIDYATGHCGGASICEDADAEDRRINSDNDFRIVFTKETTADSTGDIFIATVDISSGELTDVHQITDEPDVINYQPAWCGPDRVIWSRELGGCEPPPPCGVFELYWWELCVQDVDESGPVAGTKECFLNNPNHLRANQHPSCDSVGRRVAFAQSLGDLKAGGDGLYIEQPHQVCTMFLEPTPPTTPEQTVSCLPKPNADIDDTDPVWSPGNGAIAFSSNRLASNSDELDIWRVNSFNIQGQQPTNTTNTDETIPDLHPDWREVD